MKNPKAWGRALGLGPLAGFLALATLGLERFWLPILLVGIGSVPFWGRWYCRCICPSSRLGCLGRRPRGGIRAPMGKRWLPLVWWATLFLLFVVSLVLGLRPRLFVGLTVVGGIFGFLSSPGRWCGSWCPWGRLMTLETRFVARWKGHL